MSDPRARAQQVPIATPITTHSADCWRWHHQCGVARIEALAAALGEAVGQFDRSVWVNQREYFAALPVTADQLDRWQRALTDVAGAESGAVT